MELTKEDWKNIKAFMMRANLTGAESPIHYALLLKIDAQILQAQVVIAQPSQNSETPPG